MDTNKQRGVPKPTAKMIVFADYACPFSYIGAARLAHLRRIVDLEVDWRLIESRPHTDVAGTPVEKLDVAPAEWQTLMEQLARMAAREKLPFIAPDRLVNSRQAILLANTLLASDAAAFEKLHARLFAAHFGEGKNIGSLTVLRALAGEISLSPEWIDGALANPQALRRLEESHHAADQIGLKATPAFVIGDQVLEGAVPTAMLAEGLLETQEPH